MNIKCRKLILLTMRMNNANQKKLKFTRTKIVNLELFFKVSTNLTRKKMYGNPRPTYNYYFTKMIKFPSDIWYCLFWNYNP